MHHKRLNGGNLNIVYWAKGGKEEYQDLFALLLEPSRNTVFTDEELDNIVSRIIQGQAVDFEGARIIPNNEFYILGLAPNNARQSVRFFYASTFGKMESLFVGCLSVDDML